MTIETLIISVIVGAIIGAIGGLVLKLILRGRDRSDLGSRRYYIALGVIGALAGLINPQVINALGL